MDRPVGCTSNASKWASVVDWRKCQTRRRRMLIEVGAVALGRKINLGRMKKERASCCSPGATGVVLSGGAAGYYLRKRPYYAWEGRRFWWRRRQWTKTLFGYRRRPHSLHGSLQHLSAMSQGFHVDFLAFTMLSLRMYAWFSDRSPLYCLPTT